MIVYRFLHHAAEEELRDILALYREAEWVTPEECGAFIPGVLSGSFLFLAAFDDGRMIGMARAISDGVSDAYIQDVVVHPEFRGQGIGGKIVAFLVSELEKRGVDWIALVGEPGTEKFYSRLGFEEKKGFTLWKWNNS